MTSVNQRRQLVVGACIILVSMVALFAWNNSPAAKVRQCQSDARAQLPTCLSQVTNAADMAACYSRSVTDSEYCALTDEQKLARQAAEREKMFIESDNARARAERDRLYVENNPSPDLLQARKEKADNLRSIRKTCEEMKMDDCDLFK